MSLHNIPQSLPVPGAPGAGELVPSRYALKVGEIDAIVVSDGVIKLPTSVLAHNVEPAVLAAWLDDNFLPADTLDWPLNVVVVRSGKQTVLIDAGVGGEYPDFPRAGHLASRLDTAGIDPASITDIVLTHMHMDHVGGLLDPALRSRLSPGVPIHVSAAEARFWEAPDFSKAVMPPPVPPVLRRVSTRILNEYKSQLRLFDKEHEVAPGVVVRRTGGHTPGHSVVSLTSGGERLTFLGDAIFPVGFDHPDWQNGFEHDPEESARVRIRLLHEAAASGELLVATHLSFPSVGRVSIAGDAFRWVPAFWDY
jgi:glyoxylase-like metal-dependent hydrolase (beta-lactamase superfamily II)